MNYMPHVMVHALVQGHDSHVQSQHSAQRSGASASSGSHARTSPPPPPRSPPPPLPHRQLHRSYGRRWRGAPHTHTRHSRHSRRRSRRSRAQLGALPQDNVASPGVQARRVMLLLMLTGVMMSVPSGFALFVSTGSHQCDAREGSDSRCHGAFRISLHFITLAPAVH